MTEPKRLHTRQTADDKFRELIDNYYIVDDLVKLLAPERERLMKEIRKKLRYGRRALGVHLGNFFAINAHRIRRRQFNQAKARELLGLRLYNRAFKLQRYVQIDALEQDKAARVHSETETLEEQKEDNE